MKVGLQVYLQGSLEAVAFYQRAFGATLGTHVFHPDGTYLHAELMVDGELLMALSEANNQIASDGRMAYSATTYPAMNFTVNLKSEHAVENAYEVLKENANILYPLGSLPWSARCANLVDRFGVFWYISV